MQDLFGKYANGTLDLYLHSQPSSDYETVVEELNISVDSSNFEVIRAEVLFGKAIIVDPNDAESMGKIEHKLDLFRANFPQFLWFGKYYDDYEDYFFSPTETREFLAECQELKSLVKSEIADLTLRKLIYAFNKSIEKNLYLGFICD